MNCWQCKKEIEETMKFCPYCGLPQGEILELASAQKGSGYAKIQTEDGVYEVTFQDGIRRTLEKVA